MNIGRLKWILVAAGMITIAASAQATDDLKFGFGFYNGDAPVGGRFWFFEKLGLDVGLGFDAKEYTVAEEAETKVAFDVEFGVPFVVVGDAKTKFFVRPGVGFSSDPVYVENDWDNDTAVTITAHLGVEHWLSSRFSIQAAHGIGIGSTSPAVGDSQTEIMTQGQGISVGFHFYVLGVE